MPADSFCAIASVRSRSPWVHRSSKKRKGRGDRCAPTQTEPQKTKETAFDCIVIGRLRNRPLPFCVRAREAITANTGRRRATRNYRWKWWTDSSLEQSANHPAFLDFLCTTIRQLTRLNCAPSGTTASRRQKTSITLHSTSSKKQNWRAICPLSLSFRPLWKNSFPSEKKISLQSISPRLKFPQIAELYHCCGRCFLFIDN